MNQVSSNRLIELLTTRREELAAAWIEVVVAARLMGAECVVPGIRPQIARTIVALGIEFGDITTKATLADALRHTFRHLAANSARRIGTPA